jgi:uncharacterized protein
MVWDSKKLKAISAVELIVATVVIALDLWIPTLVILALLVVSFLLRKDKLSTLGLKKPKNVWRMIIVVFLLAFVWTIIQFSLTMPLLNHLTGATQVLSSYENLQGNLGSLFFFLFLTWTLAAFGEELVYRGYLQARVRGLFANAKLGIIVGVVFSSVLFGLAHIEQGVIGLVLTFIDAVFFSAVKLKFSDNLFASILAHGFNNTIGLVTFFLIGPVYGLW